MKSLVLLIGLSVLSGNPAIAGSAASNAIMNSVGTNSISLKTQLIKGLPFFVLTKVSRDNLDRADHQLCLLYDLRVAQAGTNKMIKDLSYDRSSQKPIQPGNNGFGDTGGGLQNVLADTRLNLRSRMELPDESKWGFRMEPHATGNGRTYILPGAEVRASLQRTNRELLAVYDSRMNFIIAQRDEADAQNRMAEASRYGNYSAAWSEFRRFQIARTDAHKRLMFARAAVLQQREADMKITTARHNLAVDPKFRTSS